MQTRWTILPILCLLTLAPATAEPCAGDAIAPAGQVQTVRDGTVRLRDDRQVRLAGLRLERGAEATLRALAGRPLTLRGYAPRTDRYGRLRAQAFVQDGQGEHWLQRDLLARGLARVAIAADRYECAAELYAAEAQARAARIGLWADPAFDIRPSDAAGADIGHFAVVEGRVLDAERKNGRVYLNFGLDWRTDFTATIAPADMKTFRRLKFDPLRLLGSRVRVRGIVQSYHGPEIEIANPFQIEALGATP